VRRISIVSVLTALAVAGGAHAADPGALGLAAHNVLDARPAAEVYWLTHRSSYSGMTTAKLAAIGGGHGGPLRARVVWATRKNYCLQSTVRGATAHAVSVVVNKYALYGHCPPRP
jgi:nicotinamidase-related amidase